MLPRLLALTLLLAAVPAARAQAPEPFRIDKNHSTVGFEVPIAGVLSKVTGKFTDFDVDLAWHEADPAQSHVRAVIRVASIDTGIDDRDADLRSPNFFDAEQFPEIVFESTRIEPAGEGYVAHGPLTMHGVTHEIALPFRVVTRPDTDGDGLWYAFAVEDYVLDRTAYGIDWEHGLLPFFVGNDVSVSLFVLTR